MGIRTVQPRLFIHTCTTIGLTFIADRAEAGGVAAGVAVEVAVGVAVGAAVA